LDTPPPPVGSWQLAVGSWQLAVGSWQLAVGSWQLAGVRYPAPRIAASDGHQPPGIRYAGSPPQAAARLLSVLRYTGSPPQADARRRTADNGQFADLP